ncbi:hypothetical protein NU219Hw_g1291t1 [Hortaea werneckii]
MQPLQRTALRSARKFRPQVQSQPRRFASGSHGGHNQQSTNESLGAAFYIPLAALPASFALYKLTRQSTEDQPFFTRYIRDTYDQYKDKWARRNDMHTQMVEAAAGDRVLFLNESAQANRRVELRFPEYVYPGLDATGHRSQWMISVSWFGGYGKFTARIAAGGVANEVLHRQFNIGSPFNVPAGHGGGNLDQVIAKYEKESFEENEKKLQQLRENNVPCEKPFEPLAKSPPAPPPGA